MERIVSVGAVIILISIILSGCNESGESGPAILSISDSITVEKIKYTFLSAYWEGSNYKLSIQGENLGNELATGYVAVLKYEMENGYVYQHTETFGASFGTKFSINPGKTQTQTIISWGEIDKDFLPVSKIYINFRKEGSNALSYVFLKAIVLKV